MLGIGQLQGTNPKIDGEPIGEDWNSVEVVILVSRDLSVCPALATISAGVQCTSLAGLPVAATVPALATAVTHLSMFASGGRCLSLSPLQSPVSPAPLPWCRSCRHPRQRPWAWTRITHSTTISLAPIPAALILPAHKMYGQPVLPSYCNTHRLLSPLAAP